MSKKYLSIEEAAAQIGISASELNRLREQGTIRAFADRGTWKFKEEDVETLVRSRQADSDPDVRLTFDEELGDQPTIIRKGGEDSGSDSDVRLVFDDSMNVPVKGDSALDDSDSDVKLAGGSPSSKTGSDSDVKIVDETGTGESSGSDSDVRLVSSDSSGEIKLAGPGSGPQGGPLDSAMYPGHKKKEDSSSIELAPAAEDSSVLDDESGISLAEGSGVALAGDSGISLEQPNDSGISLAEESSIVLSEDSGISLAPEAPVAKGKGKGKGKGPRPDDSDDLTGTIPLMDVPLVEEEDIIDTQTEVPQMDSSEEVFGGSKGDSTGVITLDEDDDYAVPSGKKKAATPAVDDEDELFADDQAVAEDEEEVVDVADEVVGEDDELGEDVFGAEDEDFAGGDVESGESISELPVMRGVAAPVEQEWGTPTFAGLVISAVLMIACGTVMFDLVRNMWHTDVAKQNPVASMLLETFK